MARALRLLGISTGMMILLSVALGILYPLAMTGIARVLYPDQADGSLVRLDGRVVGSSLAGQVFTSPAYFHTRPSATTPPDNPSATTFANLGPDSRALQRAVARDIAGAMALERPYNPGLRVSDLPVDMVTTSGSGIDPDISPANARLQAHRIAAVRRLPLPVVSRLVSQSTDDRSLGFLGEPGVNVLMLNLALDRVAGPPRR